jgi:hypothetical protein
MPPDDKAKRSTFIAEFLADPDKFRRDWDEKARAEKPDITDEQLKAGWAQLEHQLGL